MLAVAVFRVLLLNRLVLAFQQKIFANSALYKPSSQSSVYVSFEAKFGNDGSRSFEPGDVSILHTNLDNPPWWMVDLRGVFVVEQIVLTNRPDDFCLRLKNFQIDVFTTDPRQLDDFPNVSGDVCYNRTAPLGNSTYTWNCTRPLTGRYVRLVMFDNDYLHVLEVEVMTSAILSAEEMTYTAMDNTRLAQGTQLGDLSAMFTAILCADECSRLRDSLACTAFNWTPSTYRCQLIRVDPRMMIPSTALEWAEGVKFFLEDDVQV